MAGSRQALLFRSSDAGDNWTPVPFPAQQNATLHAIWIDPGDRNHWLAGVSPEHGGSGLYRTSDGGTEWEALAAFSGREVWSIASAPADARFIVAGAGDGIWLSRDGGVEWRRISPQDNAELRPAVALAVHPKAPQTVLAGTTHLPWRTGDAGASWESVHEGMLDDSDVFSIAIDRTNPDRVWASACSGMYRSADNGRSWTKLMGSSDASFRTYVIAQDPHRPNRLYAGTSDGLLRSADGGTTWRKLRPGPVKAIAFDAQREGRFYAAAGVGLLRSEDGGETFQTIHRGYSARQLVQWAPAAGRIAVWDALDRAGAWWSADGGTAWERSATAPASPRPPGLRTAKGKARRPMPLPPARAGFALLASVAQRDPAKVAIAGNGLLAASLDGGKTFAALPAPGGAVTAVLARGNEIWAATARGIFKRPWRSASPWTTVTTVDFIRGLTESGNAIIAAGGNRALISTDGGVTWKPVTPVAPSSEFHAFAANSRFLLAATSHGLFRSTDSGRSWIRAAEPGADTVHQVTVHPARPDVAFLAQFDSVWTSTDSGAHWRRMERPGLGRATIHSLAVLGDRPDRLYALTGAHGVFVTEWEK